MQVSVKLIQNLHRLAFLFDPGFSQVFKLDAFSREHHNHDIHRVELHRNTGRTEKVL